MITWVERDGDFFACHQGLRAIVGRLDGWNWGFIVLAAEGAVLRGLVNSTHDAASCRELAEDAMVDLRRPASVA